jgi:threonine dehydratase
MSDISDAVNRDQILHTERIIRPHVRRTPVIELEGSDVGLGPTPVTLKLEFLQHSGAFKVRGAFANLLKRQAPSAGVTAASGGNHGAAVAYAAKALQLPAKIFVPRVASPAKIERIRGYGATLVVEGASYADALAASEIWVQQSGAMAVHAFDQIETMLGQGSVAMEFEEQAPALETLLVPVGGGGLIAGIAAWYAGRVKIIGVEPFASPTLTKALEAGHPVDADVGGLAADSLAPRRVGERVFPITKRFVQGTVLVTDEAIREAQEVLWRVLRIVAEPGGAAAFSALASGAYKPVPGERVAVLMTGANTTAVSFDQSR